MKKYRLTEETKVCGAVLHRIQALQNFGNIVKDDLGGWIESERNLAQTGDCWVYNDAMVSGDAWVSDNAMVSGDAKVFGAMLG